MKNIEEFIGEWKGDKIQEPHEFQRDRIIAGIKIQLPPVPKKKDILYYNKKREEQYFRPTIIPKDFNSWDKKSRVEFRYKELIKRKEGIWFYSDGAIEYITGIHYFYLSYWKIDVGLPKFRDSDRDLHYLWDFCEKDKNCFGLCYFTNRRSGKTYVGTNIIFEYASRKDYSEDSRTEESECGIQSKTSKDGKKIFKKIISSWKKLHQIWKPTDSGETNPKEELRFEAPSKRSSKGEEKTYDDVLNSIISYRSSVEDSYDGAKLKRYYCDEFGKYTEGNAWERWDIVKPCLMQGANKIIGKAYFTTTVEELERKGGKEALLIYNESDYYNKKKDNQTYSGLYRYFKPSYYGLEGFIDKYGHSDIEGAKRALLNKRDGYTGLKLANEVRKFPFNIKEAFYSSTGTNVFPTVQIFEQKEYNETLKDSLIRRGNFVWDNKELRKVSFYDNPEGFFEISWMPSEENRNKFTVDSWGLPIPSNKNTGVIGVDPFDHKTTVATTHSNAAANGFKKFDINNPRGSNCFIFNYVGRREDPDLFYEDMIMAGVFFGYEILSENQKPGLINYMNRTGFKHYVFKTQQGDYTKSTSRKYVDGVSMSGKMVRDLAINNLVTYIYKYIGKIHPKVQESEYGWAEKNIIKDLVGNCVFSSLLDDWLRFDSNKWTEYDETVASMITMLGVVPVKNKRTIEEEADMKISLSRLIGVHNL